MAGSTKIEWTEKTWNIARGCTIVSAGCTNCYAQRQAIRQSGNAQAYEGLVEKSPKGPRWTGAVKFVDKLLEQPKRWRKPSLIFVNSMSDLFHEGITDNQIMQVFKVMRQESRHIFQVLTKRPERMIELLGPDDIPDNVWMGVSVENTTVLNRVDLLRRLPAKNRFISVEPLLGPLDGLDLTGIDWVIVGGESGPGARAMHPDWVRPIRELCAKEGVMFHFKQWGGVHKKNLGRMLDGQYHDDMPSVSPVEIVE